MRLTLVLATLLLAAQAAAQDAPAGSGVGSAQQLPPAYATRKLDVEIPFAVTPGSDPQAQPAAVQIFVSWDYGRNWHKYTEVAADAGKFRFKAKKDAEFWFVTETVDADKRPTRDAPKRPQLRLVVDTQKPELRAEAAVNPAGQVVFTFGVADANLNPQTLKLEYQDARDADLPWDPVVLSPGQLTPSRGGLAGRTAFVPREGLRTINVRAEIADLAGNKSFFHQQLAIPTPEQAARRRQIPSPLAMDAGARRWPSDNRLPESSPGIGDDVESIARPPARPPSTATNVVANPHVRRDRLAARPTPPPPGEETLPPPSPSPAEQPQSTFPELAAPDGSGSLMPSEETLPPPGAAGREAAPRHIQPRPPHPDDSRDDIGPIPDEEPLPAPTGSSTGSDVDGSRGPDVTTTNAIPAGAQPRLTNTRHFSLDYDLESVGPEGVADVELWGTSDGGRTWLKWGSDPDRQSPMDVEVASESTYGFRVVVIGRNGLEGNKPQAGDDADIWISIDVTRPAARITAAAYGSGPDAGKLDIRWDASDANLSQRPVTLLYSDRPDGQFAVIAAGLENTGQYLWQFDPRSPRKIYLRLEVRDDAGNIAIDQLTDPISVEGLIPRGRIRSLSPAPEPLPQSGAFGSPLFR